MIFMYNYNIMVFLHNLPKQLKYILFSKGLLNNKFEKFKTNHLQKRFLNPRANNNDNHSNKKTNSAIATLSTKNYLHKQQPSLSRLSPLQMSHKVNQTKILIMPLAILPLSSTIVMAISNPVLPSAAYAISFGSTKNLSNNDGDSLDPRIEASGNNVYTVWSDSSGEDADIFFKRSATSGDSFQSTKDLSNGKDGGAQDQRIAKEGNSVYVVWSEGVGAERDVYFKKSTNNGESFGSTINLSNDDNFSQKPEIAVVGDNVYVVWVNTIFDEQGDQTSQLFFKKSTNNGASFGSLKKLDIVRESLGPRIAASGNNVYIAVIGGSEDDEEVFFTKSNDKGNSFSKFISINNNHETAVGLDIAAKGNNVYIVWDDRSQSETHAFFKRSTDNGNSFGSIKDLGPGAGPQLDTISSNVYIVWTNGDGNIAFKASKNNGSSFASTKILSSNGNTEGPQISSSGNAVRIVWSETSNGDSDIFFRASGNEGDSFGSTRNLSNNDGDSFGQQIISSGGKVYVVWQDNTPGNFDILFKKGVD
jgi:hypothetical protein